MPPRRRSTPRSPIHRALGEAVKDVREEAGLTHEALAERLEMPFQRISELERGVANPTFATLVRIAEGLEVELSDLAVRFERHRDP